MASVIVINYNGRRFLDELLHTLRGQTLQRFETLLIDNHSQDESVSYVRNHFPWVRVFPQSENLGFSRAGNLGARYAKSDSLVFLNTDMKLDQRWLEALLAAVDSDPLIGAVASKIKLYHQPANLNGVGGMMNYLGYSWDRGMFEEDRGQYDQCDEVLFASAGAALFRRSVFLEVGGFDEKFFMYHEDVDLCWRLWLFGFRVVTAPQAVVYHHFGASTRETQGMLWRELAGERHNIRSLIKNYQFPTLLHALCNLLLLPQPCRRKWNQVKNFVSNLLWLGDTFRKRRWIQKRRKRSDSELKRLIVQSKNVPIQQEKLEERHG